MQRSIDELIAEELRKNGNNISRTARIFGVPYRDMLRKYDRPQEPPKFIMATGPEPKDIRTLGKPGWQQYVIAVKRAACAWPIKYDFVLHQARKAFDAGTHMMFQTNNQGWVVQYLYPRQRPVKPRRFFFD